MQPAFYFILPFMMDGLVAAAGIVVNLFAQDLGATPFQLGLLGFSGSAAFCLTSAGIGPLADRYPRRRLLVTGVLLLAGGIFSYRWAHVPQTLILLAVFTGVGCGCFWPTFETLLHTGADAVGDRRRMGSFNIGWTLGIGAGLAAGGALAEWGTYRALNLLLSISLALLATLLWATRDGIPATRHHTVPAAAAAAGPSREQRIGFMWVGWLSNFGMWFAGGVLWQLFPKFGRALAIPDYAIGILLSLTLWAQACLLIWASSTNRWQYRLSPLVITQIIAACGALCVAFGGHILLFGIGMALIGIGRGMTYASSLQYGLVSGVGQGAASGIHEMIIGGAMLSGPFFGGVVAQICGLRSPFLMCCAVILLAIVAETLVWRRLPAVVDAAPEPVAATR